MRLRGGLPVVETRAGRPVGSFPVEGGKLVLGCSEVLVVRPSESGGKLRKYDDLPGREHLGAHLAGFVGGAPR
ncbi:MAG: hypothetical protein QOI78_3634 [Actinomycetota bacterium]|nr:hypothetical protein [Actinomycetota bacterium]